MLSRSFGDYIALMHSELSEALEAYRNGEEPFYVKDGKPEGWAVELHDYNMTRLHRHGGKKI